MTIDEAWGGINPQIHTFMRNLALLLKCDEPFESTDDYGWEVVYQEIGITFELSDMAEYDGPEGADWGANVSVSIVRFGGEIVGGLTPMNYTPEVWCDLRTKDGREELQRRLNGMTTDESLNSLHELVRDA